MTREIRGVIMKRLLILMAVLALLFSHSAAHAFKLPDSGQSQCYQGVSPFAVISCTNTGQDGNYSINLMSFTSNGDGTVTDNNTGLMWQKCSAGQNATSCSGIASTYNWFMARGIRNLIYNRGSTNICGSLDLGGHNDWRLPTKKELITIVDYSKAQPGPTINTTIFPFTNTNPNYWTATPDVTDPGNVWSVGFYGGNVSNLQAKSVEQYVRCVRGGERIQTLIDNGDGTVSDARTGLAWEKEQQNSTNWSDALSICNNLNLAGHSDWRLPNVKELDSLTDESQSSPSINTDFFPNAFPAIYWSSTTLIVYPSRAWYVSFAGTGITAIEKDTDFGYVRCARGGQSGGIDSFVRLMHGGSPVGSYTTLQDAFTAVAEGDTIQALATVFSEPLAFEANLAVLLQGGYDSGFALNPGFTTLNGSLTISAGTVTVENLRIR